MRVNSEVISSERLTGIYTGQPGRVERAGGRGRWVVLLFLLFKSCYFAFEVSVLCFGFLGDLHWPAWEGGEGRQQGKVNFYSLDFGFGDLYLGGRGDT